ncbi:MAG: MmcQ/YjbR family DNA-binding protein [Chloroflexota bacterium]|nr:MmcQ/YjbR family DNA-binding protein [Chloroflexota bacterium]
MTDTADALEAERCFESLAAGHLADPSVTRGTGFGSTTGLRVDGRIFAMLMKAELVVKLPRDRVDELVASGAGTRLETRQGRWMKEWVSVAGGQCGDWERLVDDALAFVDGRSA